MHAVAEAVPDTHAAPQSATAVETAPPVVLATQKLSSLSALEAAFLHKKASVQAVVITDETVKAAWRDYAGQVESPSMQQFMDLAILHLEGDKLYVKIGTSMAKGMFQKDTGLIAFLREKLQLPNLGMQIDIDASLAVANADAAEDERPKSPKELLALLSNKNPLVVDLLNRFELEIW